MSRGALRELEQPVEIIAHRGYSARAPENTIAALTLALDHGATAVEFDLHVAGDGTPVLLHDETLARTTNGAGAVTDHSSIELEALDAGSWFDPAFAGEPVPSLARALDAIAGRVGRVYAEVKGVRNDEDLVELARVVRDSGLGDRTVFISMDWDALAGLRRSAPTACLGYIVEAVDRTPDALELATGDPRALIDFDARILLNNPTIAAEAIERSVPLAVWTVDDPEEATHLHAMGVRRITTNEVERLLQWRDS